MTAARRYAEDTTVPISRSRAEIEAVLERYGAVSFAYAADTERNRAAIMFDIGGRRIRIDVPLPNPGEDRFTRFRRTPHGMWEQRAPAAARAKWEQACRSTYRALLLIIKAKLEAVAAGITTVEAEFLPHIVLPDGRTVGDWVSPQIAAVYAAGTMPELLPGIGPQPEEDA